MPAFRKESSFTGAEGGRRGTRARATRPRSLIGICFRRSAIRRVASTEQSFLPKGERPSIPTVKGVLGQAHCQSGNPGAHQISGTLVCGCSEAVEGTAGQPGMATSNQGQHRSSDSVVDGPAVDPVRAAVVLCRAVHAQSAYPVPIVARAPDEPVAGGLSRPRRQQHLFLAAEPAGFRGAVGVDRGHCRPAPLAQRVAASMAFEGEPVNPTWLEMIPRRTEISAVSNPPAAYSPIRSPRL